MTKQHLLLSIILTSALLLPNFIFGEEDLSQTCLIEKIEETCKISPAGQCRQMLEKCESYYNEKSKEIEADISKTQLEKKTLQNKILSLSQKIKNLEYQIYQSNLIIKDLGLQVEDTKNSIGKTSVKIEKSKGKLTAILRIIYEEDQKPIVEILLSEEKISDFFDNIIKLEILDSKKKDILKDIKILKSNLEEQEQSLDTEKNDLEEVVKVQKLQKEENTKTKTDQEYYLGLTEKQYQEQLKEKEEVTKKASEIRAKIYELIGVRKAVTYEEALGVAKYASSQSGIRTALLLGILSQESSIGRNVGQCYLKNSTTGEGIVALTNKAISRVMNPQRDVPIFMNVVKELNNQKSLDMDPFQTLVSCPMSFGWGGAMGPAQFIPSTWVLFQDKVKEKTGLFADPWDLRDASLAASIYLKGDIDKYGSEGKAVQAYFCGSPKGTYWCKWYEKNVLYLATCHETFINNGSMSQSCQEAIGLK